MVWKLNCSSLESEEFSAIDDKIIKRTKDRPACWFGRCRRRHKQRQLKVNLQRDEGMSFGYEDIDEEL
ncbi:hypothetical protein ACROYT_G022129 [Oculina patagonica]